MSDTTTQGSVSSENSSIEEGKEVSIEIVISEKNLKYRSDFSEPETIFWLEAVKSMIIKKSFDPVSSD
jgi:hypothetical protein